MPSIGLREEGSLGGGCWCGISLGWKDPILLVAVEDTRKEYDPKQIIRKLDSEREMLIG